MALHTAPDCHILICDATLLIGHMHNTCKNAFSFWMWDTHTNNAQWFSLYVHLLKYGAYYSGLWLDILAYRSSYRTFVHWALFEQKVIIYATIRISCAAISCRTAPCCTVCYGNGAAHCVPNVCQPTVRLGRHDLHILQCRQTNSHGWVTLSLLDFRVCGSEIPVHLFPSAIFQCCLCWWIACQEETPWLKSQGC